MTKEMLKISVEIEKIARFSDDAPTIKRNAVRLRFLINGADIGDIVYFEAVRRRNGYKDSEIDLVCRSYGNEYDRDSFKPRVNPDVYYSAIRASKWYKNQVRNNRRKDKTPECKKPVSRSFHVRKRPLHCE